MACSKSLGNFAGLKMYGNKQIENLSIQYQGTDDSIQDCLDEWSNYRQFLQESCKQLKHRDVINDLCTNHSTAAIFPIMSKLSNICRVVPIHTADVERTFSQLKLIKTCTAASYSNDALYLQNEYAAHQGRTSKDGISIV